VDCNQSIPPNSLTAKELLYFSRDFNAAQLIHLITSTKTKTLVNYLYTDSITRVMSKEKFILVSLKEEESKQLAQVLANDTSRKILDFLAEKEATESDLANKLTIPISTVHYNLQALVKGKLVEADEFHYSEKGKEVLHYKLANKYIIIAPKSTFGIREKLRSILPVGIIAIAGSAVIYLSQYISNLFNSGMVQDRALEDAGPLMAKAALIETAPAALSQEMIQVGATQSFWQFFIENPALPFLFGCIFTVLIFILVEYINYKKNR
jgi:DNA-binding transcriptional ArsR family regulator